MAAFSQWNTHRDLFRFVRLPVDVNKVEAPTLEAPDSDKVVERTLYMIDPHELLEYLHCSGRLAVDKLQIATLPSAQ